jgi:hypothetical protein
MHAMNRRAVDEGQPDILDMATLIDSIRVGNEKYLPLPIRFRRYVEKSTVRADPHGMKLTLDQRAGGLPYRPTVLNQAKTSREPRDDEGNVDRL